MDDRLAPVYEIFKHNSRFYLNCLEGMDDDQAAWRSGEATNSTAYIALHVLDSRYGLARTIGVTREHKFAAKAKEARGRPEYTDYPSMDELREDWKAVTGEVRARLGQLTDADLKKPLETQAPVENKTVLGLLGFAMMHESYHIGQLSLLRKQVGLPAMALR